MKMEVNKIIKSRRQELGLTLKDVASALKIAESTVSRYESSDIQNMGIDKIELLAKVLQCTPAYLMGWETSEETQLLKYQEIVNQQTTIAAHLEGGDFTEDDMDDIINFIDYIKSKKRK